MYTFLLYCDVNQNSTEFIRFISIQQIKWIYTSHLPEKSYFSLLVWFKPSNNPQINMGTRKCINNDGDKWEWHIINYRTNSGPISLLKLFCDRHRIFTYWLYSRVDLWLCSVCHVYTVQTRSLIVWTVGAAFKFMTRNEFMLLRCSCLRWVGFTSDFITCKFLVYLI